MRGGEPDTYVVRTTLVYYTDAGGAPLRANLRQCENRVGVCVERERVGEVFWGTRESHLGNMEGKRGGMWSRGIVCIQWEKNVFLRNGMKYPLV